MTILVLCCVTPVKYAEMMHHIADASPESAVALPVDFWWPNAKKPWLADVPLALAICLFALTNHVNLFTTRGELSRPEPQRLNKVIVRASVIQTFIYWLFGVLCFLALGPSCDESVPRTAWPSCTPVNVLASPRFHDAAGTIAQALMVVIVTASIVLNLGAGRRAFFQLLERCQGVRQDNHGHPCSQSVLVHGLSTLASVFVIMLAGAYLNSIKDVLSVLGGFCVASYGFVIPLVAIQRLRSTGASDSQPRYNCMLSTVLGVCSLVGYFSVGQTLLGLIMG